MKKRCVNCFEEYDSQLDVCPHCGYVPGTPPSEIYHLFPGTELADRYIIGMVLGFGGFGITYKAWDKKLETVVAIKEYYPSGLVNRVPGTKEVILFARNRVNEYQHGLIRFLDEARNMAKFNSHPNIINIFEYFEENSTAYIVMEFLDGITLAQFLKKNRMDYTAALEVTHKICFALKSIHKSGIIHRDISPDNIFLCTNGAIKLIDFGAARFSRDEDRMMTIILKPGFAPPEQYEKINEQGPWTDIYALGATLYLMVTGIKPEESTNRKISDLLQPPHVVCPEIPEYISNTIMKAMAVDKHLRFTSVDDFEKAIDQKKKVIPLKKEKRRRKIRRFTTVFASLVLVLSAVSVFLFQWNQQKEEETLPDSSLEIWYIKSSDENQEDVKGKAFQEIIQEFTQSYPNVVIEARGISENDYDTALQTAIQEKKAPQIFENSETLRAEGLNLSEVLSSEEAAECYFLGQYDQYFANREQLPLGFVAPAIYVNTTLVNPESTEVTELSEMLGSDGKIAVRKDMQTTFEKAFGTDWADDSRVSFVEGIEPFANDQFAYYFSDMSEFLAVQEHLPARYQVLHWSLKELQASFSDLYKVNPNCSSNQKKAAIRFMEFLLSESAQDTWHVRNVRNTAPLNRNVLAIIGEIYKELDGFYDTADSYTFVKKEE